GFRTRRIAPAWPFHIPCFTLPVSHSITSKDWTGSVFVDTKRGKPIRAAAKVFSAKETAVYGRVQARSSADGDGARSKRASGFKGARHPELDTLSLAGAS